MEKEKQEVDIYKLKEIVFYAVKKWFNTDTTDYDNFVGIRDFSEAIGRWYNEGLPENELAQEVKKLIHQNPEKPKVYKKVFWKFYKQL